MVFRAAGKIEKCTVALDHPQNLIGYVDSSKGVVLNEMQTTNGGIQLFKKNVSAAKNFSPVLICAAKRKL